MIGGRLEHRPTDGSTRQSERSMQVNMRISNEVQAANGGGAGSGVGCGCGGCGCERGCERGCGLVMPVIEEAMEGSADIGSISNDSCNVDGDNDFPDTAKKVKE